VLTIIIWVDLRQIINIGLGMNSMVFIAIQSGLFLNVALGCRITCEGYVVAIQRPVTSLLFKLRRSKRCQQRERERETRSNVSERTWMSKGNCPRCLNSESDLFTFCSVSNSLAFKLILRQCSLSISYATKKSSNPTPRRNPWLRQRHLDSPPEKSIPQYI
jgi:hypothetical protein